MAAEKTFENKLKKLLKDRGAYVVKHFANGLTRVGVPDLLVCYKGRFLGIEVKAANGKPSPLQVENIEQIKSAGGIALVLYPNQYQEFVDLLDTL